MTTYSNEKLVCIKPLHGIKVDDLCEIFAIRDGIYYISHNGELINKWMLDEIKLQKHFITLVEFRNKRINEILE